MRLGNERPDPPKPLCIQGSSFETKFISSKEMEDDIPHHQLLLNHRLAASDTGAVAVQLRKPNSTDLQIVPLFSVFTPPDLVQVTSSRFTSPLERVQ